MPPTLSLPTCAQLLSRALGGPVALLACEPAGQAQLISCNIPGGIPALPVLSTAQRLELREGRRSELMLEGARHLVLAAEDEQGVLWLALRPAEGPLSLAQFAQHMVHALRNSLSSIKLATQTVARSELQGPREKKRLGIAAREIARMERLITTASEFARTPTRRQEPVDAAGALQAAVEAVRPELEARSIALELLVAPGLPPVSGDPVRLQLAFENLLVHGARAMPEGGPLAVALQEEGGAVVASLQDQGPQLAEGEQARLFTPLASGQRASGLDLALVAQVAQEIGGEVAAENVAAGGVVFRMRLGPIREVAHGNATAGR